MQGCSFKMVRQELHECTQRPSCSQDEGGGRGGKREDRKTYRLVVWKNINRCFPASAAKLLS